MPATTTRGGFRYPVGADNSKNVRTDITNLANDVASKTALYVESTAAARPAPGVAGRLHRATDTGVVTWDTGTGWDDVAVSRAGGSTITPSGNAVKGLVVKGAAGQTANPVEVVDNTGAVQVAVLANGALRAAAPNASHGFGPGSTDNAATFNVSNANSSAKGLVVRGASGQTSNLAEFQSSDGTVRSRVSASGAIQTTAATDAAWGINVVHSNPATNPLIVRGATAQTANLAEFRQSDGVTLTYLTPAGHIALNKDTGVPTTSTNYGQVFVDSQGQLSYRGISGTTTVIAPA